MPVCLFISFFQPYYVFNKIHFYLGTFLASEICFIFHLRAKSLFNKKLLLTRKKEKSFLVYAFLIWVSVLYLLIIGFSFSWLMWWLSSYFFIFIFIFLLFPFAAASFPLVRRANHLVIDFHLSVITREKGEGSVNANKKNYYYFRITIYSVWSLYRTHMGTHNV